MGNLASPRSPFDPRSEVGRALAEVDWAATDLGPWEEWPVSLTTAVRAMLGSRFSMFVVWGESSVFLCNDAYRVDSLGQKFPWALGRPMREVWAEVWDVADTRIRAVKADNAGTWDESLLLFLERSGYKEETYHTFCYGPLCDDEGDVNGVLCVVTEETNKVVADRRMAVLRDLGAALTAGTSSDSVAVGAHDVLSRDVPDVPFAAAYLFDPERPGTWTLSWATGGPEGGAAVPRELVGGDGHPWSAAIGEGAGIVDLDPAVSWPKGTWTEPPTQAVILPLRQTGHSAPRGHLVVGLNRYRRLDADYTGFLHLLADQVGGALERAQAFEEERQRHDELAALDRAKTQFFTNISHELRTPLTLLLGPAEDALVDTAHPLDDVQRGRFEMVARNGARLLKLVNSLLDFSRLEDGRVSARFEQLDLARFTTELAGMFDVAFRRAGLELTVEAAPLGERPYVDREMWAKIVLNLLSNALKATFTGGVTVRLHDDGPDGGARLEVVDTGIGIPPGELDRLFERFHRVAGARQRSHEGSGIGLALTAELVRIHGGSIDARSGLGEGSTFTVRLPYGREHLPADMVADERPTDDPDMTGLGAGYVAETLRWGGAEEVAAPALPVGDRARVLVVDDSADVREYVRDLLRDDYAVTVARDGEEALAAVRADPPDLVLTDVMMPVLDGFELLAALRADPTTAHLPVIMLSARSGDGSAVEGLEAGADDYIVKPFGARELRARVRANLELDRVRSVLAELERSRAMLDNAEGLGRLASWEYDLRERTLRVSPQFPAITGMPVEPLRTVRWEGPLVEAVQSEYAPVEAALRHMLADPAGDHEDVDVELWATRGEGERFRARIRANIARDDDGVPRFLRGSTQDVTEQRAAEAEVSAAHAVREVAAREHAIASELQRSLLPDARFDAVGLQVASYYRPGVEGTQVGGDWYDVIDLGLGRTALVIGDVMGRGVRAAAVMGQLRAATRAYARLSIPPEHLIRLLDDTVRDIGEDTIVTCVYAVHDADTQTLSYANAGHPPALLLVPGGEVTLLGSGGPPLGTGGSGRGESVPFPSGAVLALYTDGLVERRDADLDSRIAELAGRLRTASGTIDDLPDRLVSLMAADRSNDDVALLVCCADARIAGQRDARHLVDSGADAIANARRFVLERVREWAAPVEEHDVELGVSEIVTNAIAHGDRPIELHLQLAGDRLRVAVRDGGGGRPVVRRSGPQDEHGRGMLIVSAVAASWGVESTAIGKTVWCEFPAVAERVG